MNHPAALAFGTSTFGRELARADAHGLLDYVVAQGIRHLDTAALYSSGQAEVILGEWLRAQGAGAGQLHVATKIYPPYTPEAINAAMAASLRRLGLESVDLLYLHKWDPTAADPGAWRALDGLVRRGAAKEIGASNFTLEQIRLVLDGQLAAGLTPFNWLQNNHNLAVREAPPPLRVHCRARGVRVATYSPLGAGFLTGKHRDGVEPGSRFAVSPGHAEVYFHEQCWRRLGRLEVVAKRTGLDQAHLALAWALHQPGVDWVIVGGRGRHHINQALAARRFDDAGVLGELADPGGREDP